jgi:hypothetical protein
VKIFSCEHKHGSKLQMAAAFIVSMVLTAICAQTMLAAGLFSIQPSQETVCFSMKEAPSSFVSGDSAGTCGYYELNDADDVWTASPYVTAKLDSTSYVEGAASANLKIEDDFTTGVVAYHDITSGPGAPDLSEGANITFWVKSSANLGDGILQLGLSESYCGTGPSESFAIPGTVLDGRSWQKAMVSLSGTAIDYDAVKSVVLYADSDPGTVTIWLDIIETKPVLSTGNPVKPNMKALVYATVEEVGLTC